MTDNRESFTVFGTPVENLSREELIEALRLVALELQNVRTERNRWKEAGDPLKYLMQGKQP